MGWCVCIHVHDGLKEVLKFGVEGSMKRERRPSPRGAQAPKWPRWEAWNKDKGAYPRPELPVPWTGGTGSSSTGIDDVLAVAADLIEAEKADEAVKDQQQDQQQEMQQDQQPNQQQEEQQGQQQDQQKDKDYWDESAVWQLWGGCWWKETSRGWWKRWRDTAGQQ